MLAFRCVHGSISNRTLRMKAIKTRNKLLIEPHIFGMYSYILFNNKFTVFSHHLRILFNTFEFFALSQLEQNTCSLKRRQLFSIETEKKRLRWDERHQRDNCERSLRKHETGSTISWVFKKNELIKRFRFSILLKGKLSLLFAIFKKRVTQFTSFINRPRVAFNYVNNSHPQTAINSDNCFHRRECFIENGCACHLYGVIKQQLSSYQTTINWEKTNCKARTLWMY